MRWSNPLWRQAFKILTAGDLRTMVESYLESALWSSTDEDGQPLDKKHDYASWSAEAMMRAQMDCEEFIAKAGDAIDDVSWRSVGHDFWLTRNGHGAGFWDKEEVYGPDMAQFLTAIAKDFPELHVWQDPDGGLLYFE
jgi:hypothetical protein